MRNTAVFLRRSAEACLARDRLLVERLALLERRVQLRQIHSDLVRDFTKMVRHFWDIVESYATDTVTASTLPPGSPDASSPGPT